MTTEELLQEIKEWREKDRHFQEDYPPELTEYEKARHYVLVHGDRHGLAYECLKWFYKFEDETPDDPWKNANDALYEWDV